MAKKAKSVRSPAAISAGQSSEIVGDQRVAVGGAQAIGVGKGRR